MQVRIIHDQNPLPPDEWEEAVFLVTTKNRHFEKHPDLSLPSGDYSNVTAEQFQDEEFAEAVRAKYEVYPLFAYIHSGIALSLGRSYPFDCPWDSGQIGFVLVDREEVGEENLDRNAEATVETWNQFLSGDVWGYEIEDKDGEFVDSCWGFYGREYCEEQAREALEAAEQYQEEQARLIDLCWAV